MSSWLFFTQNANFGGLNFTHVQLHRGHQGGGGQGEAGADQRPGDARQQDAHLYQAMMLSLKHFKHCIYN